MSLKDDKQQNIRKQPDFSDAVSGEARETGGEENESSRATSGPESPVRADRLMEEVCERDNLKQALRQVKTNKGSAGIDRMTVDQLADYLRQHWPAIRAGSIYPAGGDAGSAEAVGPDFFQSQLRFSAGTLRSSSRGPSAAVHRCGLCSVVDLDLEKSFARVHHDKLMCQIAKRVEDKRLLRLIRAFLNAGVMEDGLVSPSVEGTPQGGPLSPLLSNLVLDELDRELERRGHRFVRHADDSNIYVRPVRERH
jgi:RNA-directed DNA polymerase